MTSAFAAQYDPKTMPIQGKLELTVKINKLPDDVTTDKNGWKGFSVDCEGIVVSIKVRPRMWTKLEEASKNYPLWVAAITGGMGRSTGGRNFELSEPAVQVFERKPPCKQPGCGGVIDDGHCNRCGLSPEGKPREPPGIPD